jgi:hypothetical protein
VSYTKIALDSKSRGEEKAGKASGENGTPGSGPTPLSGPGSPLVLNLSLGHQPSPSFSPLARYIQRGVYGSSLGVLVSGDGKVAGTFLICERW